MVSWPDDVHSPQHELSRLDSIALAALGEPVDEEFAAHLAGCSACQAELDALAATADLAREGHTMDADSSGPSSAVWDSIVAELELDPRLQHDPQAAAWSGSRQATSGPASAELAPSTVVPLNASARGTESGSGRRPTRWVLAAAAAVLVIVAGGVGYIAGNSGSSSAGSVAASAQLSAMPGAPATGTGTAKIVKTSEGEQLNVTTNGLPPRNGYYEVWLFNPRLNQMVAVGTLDGKHNGTFPVPSGLNPASYHVVDVSAQKYDGNPVHQQSVLRGQLTP